MDLFRYFLIHLNQIHYLDIFKRQIEEKKYFLELGLNPRKYYIFRAEIIRSFFGSSETFEMFLKKIQFFFFALKKLKKPPSKVAQKNSNQLFQQLQL